MEKVFLIDDGDEIAPTKYKIGDKKDTKPYSQTFTMAFAFDYISIAGSKLCFDYDKIPADDYHQLFYLKQEISSIKVSDLFSAYRKQYRFHDIVIDKTNDKKWLIPLLCDLFKVDKNDDNIVNQLPNIYQIQVYTDNVSNTAPRIVGFFGNYGIFHLLWFDYEHSIYPQIN